ETHRPLTPEEETYVRRIAFGSGAPSAERPARPKTATTAPQPELAAMHREKTDTEPDPETEAELERKRAEIREKLRQQREGK
ncbi:MAG: hypothetical protein ABL994_25370, partial [Verrucomicrobiales bacterium]